ncbi:MAG: hypothetical protein ACJ78Q_15540 [Chloroflexia bacterium]
MIDPIKAEIERRTGVPAATVDKVLTALGQIVSERYPQYAGLIGPILGVSTAGSAAGTSTTPGSQPAVGAQGTPSGLAGIEDVMGKLMGGQPGQQPGPTPQTPTPPEEHRA